MGEQGGCICGADADQTDPEGFCEVCGTRVRRPPEDHIEQALSPLLAAVSDRGLHHEKNEDRFVLSSRPEYTLLVVCDGVSSTEEPERAAASVASTIASYVQKAFSSQSLRIPCVLPEAIRSAADALRTAASDQAGVSTEPSTTVVAALIMGQTAEIAWMGDSRAYWQNGDGLLQLTRDDSWLETVLQEGVPRAVAAVAQDAHAITRWVGADADPDWTASSVSAQLPGPGMLLLCTDGLWNYAAELSQMDQVLRDVSTGREHALEVGRELIAFANAKGGRDNITVALCKVSSSPEEETGSSE